MTDFALDGEMELLRETARAFAAAELTPQERAHEAARQVAPSIRKRFEEVGLSGVEIPEGLGGGGLGSLARALVLEELAAGDAGAALALDPLGPALYPLLELGGEPALRELGLPLLGTSGQRAVLLWRPESALPAAGQKVSLEAPWVPTDRVDLLVVLCREGAFALREGIELERVRGSGLRTAGASALRVASAPLVGSWRGPGESRRALARARLYLAAMLVGVMRASVDFSRHYAMNRVAFGRPIAHHQALAFLLADMHAAVEGTRLLLWEAAWRCDRREAEAPVACAAAHVEAVEQAMFVTPNGIQVLGGHGFMQDHPVEKQMREARALGLLLGGADPARAEAAAAWVQRGEGSD